MIVSKKYKIFEDLEKIAPIIPAPIYWLSCDNILLGANQAALKMIGAKSFEEIIGKKAYDVYPKEMAEHIIQHDRLVMSEKKVMSQEESTKNVVTGEIGYVVSIKSPLFDENGEVIGIIGTSIDITAEKEAERLRLENASQKALAQEQERFTKIIHQAIHDLRSPILSVSMMSDSAKDIPENKRIDLRNATKRIEAITLDLLVKYRDGTDNEQILEKEKKSLFSIPLAIDQIIKEKEYQHIKLEHIKFKADFSQSGMFVYANAQPSSFLRILSNLLNNSVESMKEKGGEILVSVMVKEGETEIRIKDQGCGIKPEILEKINDSVSVTYGKENGSGVGLVQVREALARNKGKIAIESQEGIGTEIVITLPRAKTPDWICQGIMLGTKDILVVLDDDDSIHGAWDARFEPIVSKYQDIEVKHFTQGQEAIDYINGLSPQDKKRVFLLSDYELIDQGVNGLDVMARTTVLRSVLVTSHYSNPKITSRVEHIGSKLLPKTIASQITIEIRDDIDYEQSVYIPTDMILLDEDLMRAQKAKMEHLGQYRTVMHYDLDRFFDIVGRFEKDTPICICSNFPKNNTTSNELAHRLNQNGFSKLYQVIYEDNHINRETVPQYVKIIDYSQIPSIASI